MKRLIVAVVAVAAAVAAVGGCGGKAGQQLTGSLDQYYDLGFETTRARLYSSELEIAYLKEGGEVVVRVTVLVGQVTLEGPATIDLLADGDVTGSSGGKNIPALVSGQLVLQKYGTEEGSPVEGFFDAEIEGQGSNTALHGEFKAILALALR